MDKNFISNRIMYLLDKAELSASELSLKLGYSRGYIQSLIAGRALPKMEPFFDICNFFKISPSQFFNDETNSVVEDSALINKAYNEIQKLSEDDLLVVLSLVKRLQLLNPNL